MKKIKQKIKLYLGFWLVLFLIGSLLAIELKSLLPAKKTKTNQPTTVLGVRGLDEISAKTTDPEARDYPGVEHLETIKIVPEELEKFIAEGRLK